MASTPAAFSLDSTTNNSSNHAQLGLTASPIIYSNRDLKLYRLKLTHS